MATKCTMTRIIRQYTPKVNLALFFFLNTSDTNGINLIRAHAHPQQSTKHASNKDPAHTLLPQVEHLNTKQNGCQQRRQPLCFAKQHLHRHTKKGVRGRQFVFVSFTSAGTILSLLQLTTGEVHSSPCICSPPSPRCQHAPVCKNPPVS